MDTQKIDANRIRKIIYAPAQHPCLDIVYQDEDLIICNKQTGLLSVPGREEAMKDCLESRLINEFDEVYTVHRLDMETSGLMVYARSKDMQRALSQLFMDRQVEKSYIADIYGRPSEIMGEVDLPLICDWPNRPKQKVDFEGGKPAQTTWRILEDDDEVSDTRTTRVLLKPRTGRSHQLRVHMLELGRPILGDSLYAHDAAYEPYKRLHLHANKLSFTHPQSGELMTFESDCPF
jgi:tRNA pseudouridine32 synthase/23S rRNA pseudouridine746 synthase